MAAALRRIAIGPPGGGRSSWLHGELQRAGLLRAQVLVLAPTEPSAAALRRSWGGAPGIEIRSIRAWALELLRLVPELVGRRDGHLMSALARRQLLERAWRDLAAHGRAPLAARYGRGPAGLAALLPVFDLLAESLGSADPVGLTPGAAAAPELRELALVYQGYLTLCQTHSLLAIQELEGAVGDALATPRLRAALPWDALVLDDLDAARPGQLLLLERLAAALLSRGRPLPVLAAADSLASPAGDARRAAVVRLAEALALEPVPLPGQPLPAAALIARLSPGTPGGGPPATIVELSRPGDEGHAIAQHIAADLLAHPERVFADYAVVCWNAGSTAAIRRVLEAYGILVAGAGELAVAANPLAPVLLAGAQLVAGQPLEQAAERGLLRGPLLGLHHDEARAVSRLPGGLLALLEGHSSPSLCARSLERITALAAALGEARGRARGWEQLLIWLERSGAFEMLLHDTALPLSRAARDAYGRQIERALAHIADLEATATRLGERLAGAGLEQAAQDALALVETEPATPVADAVAFWAPDDLHGRRAQVVFLAGLDEESLPRRQAALQPADEHALATAFGALPGFVLPQRQVGAVVLERARRELGLALSRAADEVVLSYSRSATDGRPQLPSPLFLELLGPQAIQAERLDLAPDEQAARLRRGLGQNNPPLHLSAAALHELPPAALLPELEVVQALGRQAPGSSVAPQLPILDEGFRASASAIREYLSCPRRYFYGRLLGLDEGEGERLALGQLFHKVVERLLDEWDAHASDARVRRALKLLREHWRGYADRLGPPLHQASYRRMIRAGLVAFVEHEAAQVRPTGRRPVALERRFQLRWDDGSLISGVIDRVDRLPDGRYAIIDYKTGNESPTLKALLDQFVPLEEDDGWLPTDVQLPLYALALERGAVEGLEAGPVAEVSLLFPFKLRTASGRLSDAGWRRVVLVPEGPPQVEKKRALVSWAALERSWQEVGRALAAMRAGPFAPRPREGRVCRSCAYRFTCPQPLPDDEGGEQ